jgi:cytochrome c peroxidase
VFDDPALAWNGVLLALEVFQQSPADFYPYTSKYDAYLRRQAVLSKSEERGMLLFNDATKGNCANCHISGIKRGAFPQFTDRGHIAIGVPRNPAIPANADAGYRDLGLCGPLRTDFGDRPEYCGLFKTPTLRNVALRGVFFHNGAFTRLQDVVAFYAERDLHPERFYPRDRKGRVLKYDDLPTSAIANVNTEAPFDRAPGDKPALSKAEIADVVAFLRTLTDGYHSP